MSAPSLLLVDDDAPLRDRLARALRERGYEVRTAGSTDEALALAREVAPIEGLRLRGLMGMASPGGDTARQRAEFGRLRETLRGITRSGIEMDTLSMGMSQDLEAAIAEGATMVRVGTALFGERRA